MRRIGTKGGAIALLCGGVMCLALAFALGANPPRLARLTEPQYTSLPAVAPVAASPTASPSPLVTPAPVSSPVPLVEIISLSTRNTLTFRGVVTESKVAALSLKLLTMSANLPEKETIYLVMDTPGGDVDAGNKFIDLVHSIPQKVKTITVFSASMGFHMVQNFDERLILPHGELMSHRAKAGGMSGEVPGELETRMDHLKRLLLAMDSVAALRMQMSTPAYREMIRDEYWVYGFDAVAAHAADRVVLAKCDSSFAGTVKEEMGVFFGMKVYGTMSSCPLITAVLDVDSEGDDQLKQKIDKVMDLYVNDKQEFIQNYIE